MYGGPHYKLLGQKPCIHHTFCHAAGLADALCGGLKEDLPAGTLPCDTVETKVKHYPEIDTYKIKRGNWLASVTGYDFSNFRGGCKPQLRRHAVNALQPCDRSGRDGLNA